MFLKIHLWFYLQTVSWLSNICNEIIALYYERSTSEHLFFINTLIFKPLPSHNNSEKFGMVLLKPGNVTVNVLFINKIDTKTSASCMLAVASKPTCRPELWGMRSAQVPVAGFQSVASLCVPAHSVITCQLRPAAVGLIPSLLTHQSLLFCFCYTTMFVAVSLIQIHVLLKPVFCFIIIIFIIIIFAVSLGRRFL